MTDEADDRLGQLAQRWQTDKSPRVALQLAEEYRRQERFDEAAGVLEESIAENPHSISGRVALGRVLLEGDREARAAEVLAEVIESDATQLVATKLLVEAFIRLGRGDDARERLRYYGLLNDTDPDIPELRQRIGQLTADDLSSLDDTRAPGVAPSAPAVELIPTGEGQSADDPDRDPDLDDDPFALAAPPPPVAFDADDDDPFPDLVGDAEPVVALSQADDDPFDFLAPAPAARAESATAVTPPSVVVDDDPFELGVPPAAPLADHDPLADVLDDTVGFPAVEPAPEPGTAPVLDDEEGEDDELAAPEPALAMETAPSVEPEPEPAPEPATSEAPAATATLGQLYLRQGHLDDAEEMFRQVLDADPHHEAARAGLDQVEERRREAASPERPELTAEDLLADDRPDGLTAKKRLLFERYLERIRRSADADVH
jgi:tetratricopeptide (TPR) repeat protein